MEEEHNIKLQLGWFLVENDFDQKTSMVITIIIRDFYLFLVCGNKYHVVVFNANSLNVCVLRYKLSFCFGVSLHTAFKESKKYICYVFDFVFVYIFVLRFQCPSTGWIS